MAGTSPATKTAREPTRRAKPLEMTEPSKPTSRVADVLAPVAVDIAYSYRIPAELSLQPGDFVEAPLGARMATGVVWSIREGGGDNLKAVARRRELTPLRQSLRDFLDWVARWTLAPRGMVLRMAIRAPEAAPNRSPPRHGVRRIGALPTRLTPARTRVLAALGEDLCLVKSALAQAAQCGVGVRLLWIA